MAEYDYQSLLAQFQPTQEDRDNARRAALRAAAFGLLGARKGQELDRIGQAGLLGMNVYGGELAGAQRAAMERMQAAQMAMQLREQQQKFQDQDQVREAMGQVGQMGQQSPMQGAMAAAPSLSPTNQNVAQVQQAAQAQPTPGVYEQLSARADQLEALAQKMKSPAVAAEAQKYRLLAEKYAPQYGDTETVMQDGRPVLLQKFKNRAPQVLPGYQPKPDYKQVDTGSQIGFYDPLTGSQGGMFAKTMTPGEVASNEVARGNLDVNRGQLDVQRGQLGVSRSNADLARQRLELERQNAELGKWTTNVETGLQVNTATGEARPIKMDGREIGPKMTTEQLKGLEDVRKTSATLDTLIKTFKPEFVGIPGSVGEFADKYASQVPVLNQFKNAQVNPERVQFRQNAATVVNNYINQITGATVGQQGETDRLMRAVPNTSDSPQMFKAKMMQMRANLDQLPAIIANNPNLRGMQSQGAPRVIDFNSLPK